MCVWGGGGHGMGELRCVRVCVWGGGRGEGVGELRCVCVCGEGEGREWDS